MESFLNLFSQKKPLIACIHLQALPGSPYYSGHIEEVMEKAIWETRIFLKYGVDALIVENFRDFPFYPDSLPSETIASLAVVTRLVKSVFLGPVGVNALRNDAAAALSAAHAAGADFIRVNVHTGAAITDQGIIEGQAHNTLRLRKNLQSNIAILADVRVKHASPLGNMSLKQEVKDNIERGLADGIVVSGSATGATVDMQELKTVREATEKPVIIGSGTTIQNLSQLSAYADAFIIGSFFKKDGKAQNDVEEEQVKKFLSYYHQLLD